MSIYFQNYTNWFLIFVNDWSTDNSEKIIRDWISNYNLHNKVKVITKENGWVNSAVQKWLEEIKSMCDIEKTDSLISFCDCDDVWTREKLNTQVKYMIEHQECWLSFHDNSIIDGDGILTSMNQSKNQYLENFSFFYISILWIAPASNRIMFKAEYIKDLLPMPINLPPKYQAQDEWVFLMLSLKNVQIHHIKKLLTYHRLWHYSASFQLSNVWAKDFWENKKIIYTYLQERVPEKDLTYTIKFKDDFFKRKLKYWIIPTSILILLWYPKASFACTKYVIFKIKASMF